MDFWRSSVEIGLSLTRSVPSHPLPILVALGQTGVISRVQGPLTSVAEDRGANVAFGLLGKADPLLPRSCQHALPLWK